MTSASNLWPEITHTLQQGIGDAKWVSTFAGSQLIENQPNSYVLEVPNDIVRDRIINQHLAHLEELITQHTSQPVSLDVQVSDQPSRFNSSWVDMPDMPSTTRTTMPSTTVAEDLSRGASHSRHPSQPQRSSQPQHRNLPHPAPNRTEPRFSFENFVSGDTNCFAYQATMAVAENPGRSYNPLFIFGDVGLGKTHLLQAAAHFIRTRYPEKTTRYMSTENFLNDFLTSIRKKRGEQFRNQYRKLDVLILDDIQILENKESLQEELFHTFNYLRDHEKQLIFSSDRPPNALESLQDRLRSRFKSGLITDVQPPKLEVRLAILKQNIEQENRRSQQGLSPKPPVEVPDDVLMFIAERCSKNIRELEGALTKVLAHSQLMNVPPNFEITQSLLNNLIPEEVTRAPTAQDIINLASETFAVPIEDLLGTSRKQNLVTIRHITMHAIREYTDLSFPAIGSLFAGKDHTTVMHAVNKITEKVSEDRNINSKVIELANLIKARRSSVRAL